jgi:SSS family solute:Na+ symporter
MKDSGIGSIDLIIILAYIIGILAIGLLSVRKKKMTSINYFLAGRSSKWPIVGAAGSCGFWL